MREHEAERAAARRNREDPRRDRFVFYALDESAGLAPDAWDVAMRLRRDDERPQELPKASRRLPRSPKSRQAARAAVSEPEPAAMEGGAMESVATEQPPEESMAIELLAREPLAAEPHPVVAPHPPAEPAPELVDEPTETYDAELDAAPPQEAVAIEDAAIPPEPGAAPGRRRRRFGLVRLWGVFVMLVGLAFVATVLTVAIAFSDYTHFGTVAWAIGVAAGLFAMWVGFALARRRH